MSVGYQNVHILDSHLDTQGAVKLGLRFNIAASDSDTDEVKTGLEAMIDDPTTSDMTITCKDKVFNVHKNILCARSSVISKLLSNNLESTDCPVLDAVETNDDESDSDTETSEDHPLDAASEDDEDLRKTSVLSEAYILTDDENEDDKIELRENDCIEKSITIDNSKANIEMLKTDQSVVKLFLYFIYTGRFKLVDQKSLESLLSLSCVYEVSDLKLFCEESLMENMSSANIATLLYLAHLHDCNQLKSSALKFCKENHQSIIKVNIPGN